MKQLSFDDAYFVRMKFEKSIKLPKAPQKTPKKQLFPFLAINQASKPFSPLKHNQSQKQKASQYQIDEWVFKKQMQVKKKLDEQNYLNRQLDCQKLLERLSLKKKQGWEMLKLSKSPYKKAQYPKTIENQISPSHPLANNTQSKLNSMNSFVETEKSNSNPTQTQSDEFQVQTIKKSNSTFNYFPSLLKSKQNKEMNKSLSSLKSSQRSYERVKNQQKKGIQMANSHSGLKLFSKRKSYSQRSIIFPELNEILQTEKQILQYSQPQKTPEQQTYNSPYTSNKNSRMNPIYYDNNKGNRLIKRYENREMSPIQKKDLKNKYSHLEKRLDSILRSVKTQKLSSN